MLWYAKTATSELAYDDADLVPLSAGLLATRATRLAALQSWIDAHPGVDLRNPPAALQIVLNLLKAALATEIASHVVNLGQTFTLDGGGRPINVAPKLVAISAPLLVARWDGKAPLVTMVVGTFPSIALTPNPGVPGAFLSSGGIPFAGWPQTDVPPDPVVYDESVLTAKHAADQAASAARQVTRSAWNAAADAQLNLSFAAYQAWCAANPFPG